MFLFIIIFLKICVKAPTLICRSKDVLRLTGLHVDECSFFFSKVLVAYNHRKSILNDYILVWSSSKLHFEIWSWNSGKCLQNVVFTTKM